MDETRRIRAMRLGVFIVIVVVILVFAARSASAANCGDGTGNPCQCGDTVIGDWTFTGDMTCPSTGDGLIIGANNIVIDGAGYKMTGNENNCLCYNDGLTDEQTPAPHCGIRNNGNYDNVVIKNLEIENFCTGIALGDATHISVDNNTVTGCYIHHNGNDTECGAGEDVVTHGIHIVAANNCNITKNEITYNDGTGDQYGSGGNGIFMFGRNTPRGNYNNFTCNNLSYNAKSGFFMHTKCMHNIISSNTATGNAEGGIMYSLSDYNEIKYNNMSNNANVGCRSRGGNNDLMFNTIMNNGPIGIDVVSGFGTGSIITNNTVCGHTKDIQVGDPGNNTGDSNTCGSSDIAGACDWSCDTLVPVYFDFDSDGYYSEDRVGCSCDIVGGRGECACCNPGLFNSSGAAQYCAGGVCTYLNPGTDPNDCDASTTGHKPPVADALVYDEYNNVGSKHLCKVCFDGSGSHDPDGSITSYEWSFGDGAYGTDMICEHIYASWNWNGPDEPGNYYEPFYALLTVTDDEPEINTTYFDVIVHIAGDANGDGVVNIMDASLVGFEWGRSCSPPDTCWRDLPNEWADRADLNNDHEVNILDMVIIGTRWKDKAW